VIDRFEELFREIRESTAPSPKVNPLSSESSGTKITRQDLAEIVQGWVKLTDDVAKNSSVSTNQKGIQPLLDILVAEIGTGNLALNTKAATLLAALTPFLRQGVEDSKAPHVMNEMIEVEGSIFAPKAKGSSESFAKHLNGTDLDLVTKQVKDTAFLTNVQQKSDGMLPQENKTPKIFQGALREDVQKGDSMPSTEVSGAKDIKNQNSSAGIGVASSLVATNVTDGKSVAIPVWEQISTVVREQVMDRRQALKELNIQLHPADLGKIQIGMRWENGQVHLVVQASEAATGQLLQNQLSDLRQNLINQGVNCGMLQMGQGGERQQNPRGDESHRTFNQNTDQNEGEDQSSVSNSLSLGQDGINRINVTA
jgi:flagellar hook-length control protein FliK